MLLYCSTASGASGDIKSLIESHGDDLNLISDWLIDNRLVINWTKTLAILFNFNHVKSNPSFIVKISVCHWALSQ